MATLLTLLLCCAHVCKGQQATAVDTSDTTNSIERNVVNSYDVSKTFDENFYSILGIICPQSIYCFGNDTSTIHVNGNVFQNILDDKTNMSTNSTSTNQSYPIAETRANLKAKSHALQGCCTSCSCEHDCAERNNCCPAMEPAAVRADDGEPEGRVVQECVYASIKTYLGVRSTREEADGRSYFMVTDCYADNVSEDLITKCRRPDPESPDEVRPVYSTSSGRNYKNRFCAECNNDNTVTPWLAEISFDGGFSLTGRLKMPPTPTEMYKSILRSQRLLQLLYIPPANMYLQTKNYECFVSNTETLSDKECEETNDFDRMKFLKRACAAHQIKYESSKRTYDNVFCLLCQSPENVLCRARLRNIVSSFTALIDLARIKSGSRTETTRNTETPCHEAEYFDEVKKICRDLQCPPGEAFDDDTCVSFLHNITRMRMKIYLEIGLEEPSSPATESFKDQLDEKASTFLRKLNRFLNVRVGVTKTTGSLVFRETSSLDNSHMVLHYVSLFSLEGMADIRVIMEKMFNALNVGLSTKILDVPMKITFGRNFEISTKIKANLASLFDSDTIIEPLGSATADSGTLGIMDYRYAQTLNKLAFCKRVVLEEDEIELLRYNSSAVGLSQTYLDYVFYDKDGSMCLDDFEIAFLSLLSEAVFLRLHTQVVYLACLIFYI